MLKKCSSAILISLAASGLAAAAPTGRGTEAVSLGTVALRADERLTQPVTLHGVGVPVKELLQRLSAATGARLTCSQEVGDRPVVVLVDAVPAARVLTALCELFHYRLRVFGNPDTPPEKQRYQLVRPQSDRAAEARLRRLDLQAFQKRMAAYTLAAAPEDDDLKGAEKGVRAVLGPELGPAFSYRGGYGVRRLPLVLSALDSDQTQVLYEGRWVVLRVAELPDSIRSVILPCLGNALFLRTCRDPKLLAQNPTATLPDAAFEQATVALKADPEVAGTDHGLRLVVRGFDLRGMPEVSRVSASVRFSRMEMGFGGRGAGASVFDYSPARIAENRKQREALKLRLDPPMAMPTPGLAKLLPVPGPRREPPILWEIHRFTSAPILSDYSYRMGWGFGPEAGATLGDAIDHLRESFRVSWRVIEGIHTFRSQGWYAEDHLAVRPDRERRWVAEARQARALSVELLQEMAALSNSQLRRLADYGLLPGLGWLLDHPDELASLRLLAHSTEQQRRALTAGLPVETLSTTQQEMLEDSDHVTAADWKTVRLDSSGKGRLAFIYQGGAAGERTVAIGAVSVPEPLQAKLRTDCPDLEWTESHPKRPDASGRPPAAAPAPGPEPS